MGMIIAGAGQGPSDSLILQRINPAANGSACPGQNVTLNCTVVRSMQAAVDIIMTLSYKGTVIVSNSGTSTAIGVFTAEFITGDLSAMSDITIFSVPLSHHNSEITCETTFAVPESSGITVAGACRCHSGSGPPRIRSPGPIPLAYSVRGTESAGSFYRGYGPSTADTVRALLHCTTRVCHSISSRQVNCMHLTVFSNTDCITTATINISMSIKALMTRAAFIQRVLE